MTQCERSSTQQSPKVAFVCLHGSAKSVIAAAQFRNLATSLGVAVEVSALGTEPDAEYPPHVLEGLRKDGLTTRDAAPREATAATLKDAQWVISFGPAVAHLLPDHSRMRVWNDVPAVSDGYEVASRQIHQRVALLVDELLKMGGPTTG